VGRAKEEAGRGEKAVSFLRYFDYCSEDNLSSSKLPARLHSAPPDTLSNFSEGGTHLSGNLIEGTGASLVSLWRERVRNEGVRKGPLKA
jgi:hypothetical protein